MPRQKKSVSKNICSSSHNNSNKISNSEVQSNKKYSLFKQIQHGVAWAKNSIKMTSDQGNNIKIDKQFTSEFLNEKRQNSNVLNSGTEIHT
jgi:hypothetical protein